MWQKVRAWRRRHRLARCDSSEIAWRRVWEALPLLDGMPPDDARRLRELACLFLTEKTLEPVQGMELEPWMAQQIALQACLPILNLGLDWYRGWYAVIVYPDTFVTELETEDETGLVHRYREARSGEAWERGPLILSWADADESRRYDGWNVILHEAAHKLDALDGGANGKPPLHRGMRVEDWSRAFQAAYSDLELQVDNDLDLPMDAYALESPAEFFAVASESFFETPDLLEAAYPALYDQLRSFYRQDPLVRLEPYLYPARMEER